MSDLVQLTRVDGIAVVTINNPPVKRVECGGLCGHRCCRRPIREG
jgi:hypothetical protein